MGGAHRRGRRRSLRRPGLARERLRAAGRLPLLGQAPMRADLFRIGARLLGHRPRAARGDARRRAAPRLLPHARGRRRGRPHLPSVRRLGRSGLWRARRGDDRRGYRGERRAARTGHARDRLGEPRNPLSRARQRAAGRPSDSRARPRRRRRLVPQSVGRRAVSGRCVAALRHRRAFSRPARHGADSPPWQGGGSGLRVFMPAAVPPATAARATNRG